MKNYCKEYDVFLGKDNYLGKGMWTKAYRISEDKVILLTTDHAKECIATFCQDIPHIPVLDRLDDIGDYQCYIMPFYRPLQASHKKAWTQYKIITEILETIPYTDLTAGKCIESYQNAFEYSELQESIKEAFEAIISSMCNYTDNFFIEASPRNLKIDQDENLILLDVIGDSYELDKKRKKRF